MPRFMVTTAGESHGPAIVAIVDGVPSGLTLEPAWIDAYLARRGYGIGIELGGLCICPGHE